MEGRGREERGQRVCMPGRIEVGRSSGFYRAVSEGDDTKGVTLAQDAIFVNCVKLRDPLRWLTKEEVKTTTLDCIKEIFATGYFRQLTAKLVDRIVQGVLQGKVVFVFCRLGKHRSQAIAALAAEKLRLD